MNITGRLINMRNQKISDKEYWYLELLDETLSFKYSVLAEEPKDADDINVGWEEIQNSFERLTQRKAIAAIDLEFLDTPEKYKDIDADKWKITVHLHGVATDLVIYFRKEEDARKVYEQLKEWWLK